MSTQIRHCAILIALFIFTACKSDRPELILTYSPKNAVVTIDGFEPAQYSSPHTFEFYKTGMYRLDVKADGYIPLTMMVSVEQGKVTSQTAYLAKQGMAEEAKIAVAQPEDQKPEEDTEAPKDSPPERDPVPVQADTKMFTVAVESVPPGARVTCSRPGSSTYTDHGMAPVELELEATGAWEIKLELAGYETARRVVVVPASARKVILTQILSQTAPGQKPLVQPNPVDEPKPLPPSEVPGGKLFVTTDPRTEVSVDGKVIGNTPIEGYPLPTGTHKILMENRDLGKRKVRIVEIEPAANVRLAEEL